MMQVHLPSGFSPFFPGLSIVTHQSRFLSLIVRYGTGKVPGSAVAGEVVVEEPASAEFANV